jgi:hypothetical protein
LLKERYDRARSKKDKELESMRKRELDEQDKQ